ncbi:MAG: MJ0042-type zinc finger domain-containing protein, partial [Pseudomonadota bacterium]|nr:MJ0042-type zinc finger domain-containing protein [Pseudomonadota bacterium]
MADKVTCCPHCNTSFRITDSQLASAKGAVRCGSCLQVFKASDHLVINDAEPSEHQEPEHQEPEYRSPEPFSPSSSDEDSAPTDDETTDDDSDDLLISDDMDDDAEQDDFSAEFLVDTQAPQAQGGMFDRKITPKTEEHNNTDDDSWAEALLDEDDSDRREPVFTITGETEEDQAEDEAAAEQHLIDSDSAYTQTHAAENIEPGNVDGQPQNREILNSIADAPVEMDWHPEH